MVFDDGETSFEKTLIVFVSHPVCVFEFNDFFWTAGGGLTRTSPSRRDFILSLCTLSQVRYYSVMTSVCMYVYFTHNRLLWRDGRTPFYCTWNNRYWFSLWVTTTTGTITSIRIEIVAENRFRDTWNKYQESNLSVSSPLTPLLFHCFCCCCCCSFTPYLMCTTCARV